jgi:hypothetical protein
VQPVVEACRGVTCGGVSSCEPSSRERVPLHRVALGIIVVEDISQKLLSAHLVDENALQKAALQQKTGGGSLTGNLVKIGALTEEQLLEFLAKLYGCPALDLKSFEPDPALTRLLPGDVATKFMALPISKSGRRLVVAMANPANIFAIDDIKFITGYDVEPRVASDTAIKKALDRAYDSAGTMADVMKNFEDDLAVVEEEAAPEAEAELLGRMGRGPDRQARELAHRGRGAQGRVGHPPSSPTRRRCACASASTVRCTR